uniref:Uncharacterized protein n=1 Tax=Setaria italica TaxID=4555 RepID=K3YBI4_SETIT
MQQESAGVQSVVTPASQTLNGLIQIERGHNTQESDLALHATWHVGSGAQGRILTRLGQSNPE